MKKTTKSQIKRINKLKRRIGEERFAELLEEKFGELDFKIPEEIRNRSFAQKVITKTQMFEPSKPIRLGNREHEMRMVERYI